MGYSDLLLETKRTCPRGRSEKGPLWWLSGFLQPPCCTVQHWLWSFHNQGKRLDQRTQETRSQGRAWVSSGSHYGHFLKWHSRGHQRYLTVATLPQLTPNFLLTSPRESLPPLRRRWWRRLRAVSDCEQQRGLGCI